MLLWSHKMQKCFNLPISTTDCRADSLRHSFPFLHVLISLRFYSDVFGRSQFFCDGEARYLILGERETESEVDQNLAPTFSLPNRSFNFEPLLLLNFRKCFELVNFARKCCSGNERKSNSVSFRLVSLLLGRLCDRSLNLEWPHNRLLELTERLWNPARLKFCLNNCNIHSHWCFAWGEDRFRRRNLRTIGGQRASVERQPKFSSGEMRIVMDENELRNGLRIWTRKRKNLRHSEEDHFHQVEFEEEP